jgi:uncharacterized phosphosugar-binding protein
MWVDRYLDVLASKLQEVKSREAAAIAKAAEALAETLARDGLIYVFGCGHSAMMSMDLFYRAGGLVLVHPIFDERIILTRRPVTETTKWEQSEGWVQEALRDSGAREGDAIVVFSTSGRNGAPIDMALAAREAALTVIAVTSRAYASSAPSRHSSGKRLHDVADYVIDNHVDPGDAALSIPGLDQRVGPTSTALSSAIGQALIVAAVGTLVERGERPPVYVSANLPGGEERNEQVLERYRERLSFL